ncbi:MAG: tRNA glutamyl-Q(34) synthetase GluQRS [Halodesulfovibrio sp.]
MLGTSSCSGPVRGRLAPSPTGFMHLGNAWSFLLCWLAVRSKGGTLVLRMEDIDPDRSRPEFVDGIMRDLEWLGLDWDEGPDVGGPYGPYVQSERYGRYEEVLAMLEEQGHVYPCFCTRKELRALASAPHAEDYGAAYPGICLNLSAAERSERMAEGRKAALRLHCGEHSIGFHDVLRGDICLTWEECGGDFAVRRSDGVFAYQLAVVIDDADQHITQIVRGDDILHCTPRQVLVYRLLGKPVPTYAHVPLVFDHEGERLAKRHRHFELSMMREAGIRPEAVVGYLAFRAGLQPEPAPARPDIFCSRFRLEDIPLTRVELEPDILDILSRL